MIHSQIGVDRAIERSRQRGYEEGFNDGYKKALEEHVPFDVNEAFWEGEYDKLLLENQALLFKVADLQDRETVYINKIYAYEKER